MIAIERLPETHLEWRNYFSNLPVNIRRGGDLHGLEHARICRALNEIIDHLNEEWSCYTATKKAINPKCICGHFFSEHNIDANQCWNFDLVGRPKERGYCTCPKFVEDLTNDSPPL